MLPQGMFEPLQPRHDGRPRPAREITIEVRKRATRDNANYASGRAVRQSQPVRSKRARWWRRLAGLRH